MHAKVSKAKSVLFVLTLLIPSTFLTACSSIPAPQEVVDTPVIKAVPVDEGAMLEMINVYRKDNNLPPLVLDPALSEVSLDMAHHIAERDDMNTWAHTAFGLSSRLKKAGYPDYYVIGENLGAGYASLDAAFAGWKGSAGHNKNLLHPYATRIGIGRTSRSNGKWRNFWAMTIARPKTDGRPDIQE